MSFGLPDRSATYLSLRPHLNLPIHFSTTGIDEEDSP